MRVAIVKAAFDDEPGVWFVEHSDIEGLRAAGDTFKVFRSNVASATADFLSGAGGEDIPIEIVAHASVRTDAAARGIMANSILKDAGLPKAF